jgi:hypothetical protein
MSLLHVFILSIAAYLLFKFLAPLILNFVTTSIGVIGNITLMNALLFGGIFVALYKLNEQAKLLELN